MLETGFSAQTGTLLNHPRGVSQISAAWLGWMWKTDPSRPCPSAVTAAASQELG